MSNNQHKFPDVILPLYRSNFFRSVDKIRVIVPDVSSEIVECIFLYSTFGSMVCRTTEKNLAENVVTDLPERTLVGRTSRCRKSRRKPFAGVLLLNIFNQYMIYLEKQLTKSRFKIWYVCLKEAPLIIIP